MHLFFYLLEDDLIVPVVPCLLEDSHKEEFIQFPDLVDIHEDGEGLLTSDDLAVDHGCLEVGDNDAEIPDVALLSVQELFYDHLALEEVFDLAAHLRTGQHTPD